MWKCNKNQVTKERTQERAELWQEVDDNEDWSDDEKVKKKKEVEKELKDKYERRVICGENRCPYEVIKEKMFEEKLTLNDIYRLTLQKHGL